APHSLSATKAHWPGDNETTSPRNIFLDLLQLPTVLYWDHVLTQAMYSLRWPDDVENSRGGVIEALRALFMHPRAYHYFPDTGHLAAVTRLGLGRFDARNHYAPGVPHEYLDYGGIRRWRTRYAKAVAFFGNLWITAAVHLKYPHQELIEVRQK